MALMRQYAIEHGASGITSNAVNADRIRTGLMTDEMVAERSKARGVTPEAYMRGNLLKREVLASDVAAAFVHLVKARASTGRGRDRRRRQCRGHAAVKGIKIA